MRKKEHALRDMIRGGIGGAMIAAGAMVAIDYMERGPYLVILFLVAGIAACMLLERIFCSISFMCLSSAAMFICGALLNITFIKYAAPGFAIYTGCTMALPERDAFTDAVTAAWAAAGFMTALAFIL